MVFRPDLPRHAQVATHLRDRITRGELAPRYPIPSETQLQQEFGVSRDTVRKAIGTLREEGYVSTIKGLGSFVRDKDAWPGTP